MKTICALFSVLALFLGKSVVAEDKTFVILISSYNNAEYCEANLNSVFKQTYLNYRVVYIDDGSADETSHKAKALAKQHDAEEKFTLIRNNERKGDMENYYRTILTCNDDEIVVLLKGDDWLADTRVLEYLNRYYQGDIWLTYGSYIDHPTLKRGDLCQRIPHKVLKNSHHLRAFLAKGWIMAPLQTFYVKLFKQVKLQDFLQQGAFIQSRADQALMIPMAEMAGRHCLFVEDVCYVHNATNPLNEEKVNLEKRNECMQYLLGLEKYEPIFPTPLFQPNPKPRHLLADIVIFSFDRPLQLYACLESIQRYMTGVDRVSVIYRTSNKVFAQAYIDLQHAFPQVHFIGQSANFQKDFKPMLLSTVYGYSAEYVVFAPDDVIVKDTVNFVDCIEAMEKTGAFGFYLRLGKHVDYCYRLDSKQKVPDNIRCGDEIFAWQFLMGDKDWASPLSLDMTLFKKSTLHKDLADLAYTSPNSLQHNWEPLIDKKRVGLFYNESKVVNIPLNVVNNTSNRHMNLYSKEELLALFRNGMKMDISSLFRIKNRSAHIEFEPAFKRR